jgi:hypothetical protein
VETKKGGIDEMHILTIIVVIAAAAAIYQVIFDLCYWRYAGKDDKETWPHFLLELAKMPWLYVGCILAFIVILCLLTFSGESLAGMEPEDDLY